MALLVITGAPGKKTKCRGPEGTTAHRNSTETSVAGRGESPALRRHSENNLLRMWSFRRS